MRTLQDVISIWKIGMRDHGTQKYIKSSRPELLEQLIDLLLEHGIDFDTAKTAKKQVIDILTTEEGKKAKGKHKDWIINISDEFIAQLDQAYPKSPVGISGKTLNPQLVIDWISLKLEQPEMGVFLKKELQKDILESSWINTGKDAPAWAEKFYRETVEIVTKDSIKIEEDEESEDWCFDN